MSELKVDKVSPRSGNYVALNTVGSKNTIINGDMSIAQRGTSVTTFNSDAYHTVDRWKNSTAGSISAEFTISQDSDVPTGQGFSNSLKYDCTTANASLGTSTAFRVQTRIEGQNLQYLKKGTSNAESLTMSFWVKSNKTGTYICELFDADNDRAISKSYTIDSASTWEKKTITFTGDTTGAFDNDNAQSLQINFYLFAGTDYTSGTLQTSWGARVNANRAVGQVNLADSTSNDWYITGVQLEAGTTASDFEFLPFDVNLQRCQRYFEKSYEIGVAPGTVTSFVARVSRQNQTDNSFFFNTGFETRKRANPTVTIYSYDSGASGNIYNSTGSADVAVSSVIDTSKKISYLNLGSNVTDGNTIGYEWTADAEL